MSFIVCYRSAIIEAFEKSKQKYDPEAYNKQPNITVDQIRRDYLARIQTRPEYKTGREAVQL